MRIVRLDVFAKSYTVAGGTRAGMGRRQGRYCGPILARLAADRRGIALDEAAHWAPRPPVKPIAIADIIAGA
jgi:hypothetical protein